MALKQSGEIPKAISSMCLLVVNNDKYGKPHHDKSCIAVLGNFKDKLYQKSQRSAPFLKCTYIRLLTAKEVGNKRILQQGDYHGPDLVQRSCPW